MFSYDLKDLSVLVVEDVDHFRELITTILKTLEIENVFEARDGLEAMEVIKGSPLDFIFMDWKMSGMDGIECVRMIRKGHGLSGPYVPVIMITGHAEDEFLRQAKDAGVNEVLIKPISARSLLSCFIRVLERKNVFVNSEAYFGPDRRNVNLPQEQQEERRTAQRFLELPEGDARAKISDGSAD